MVASMRAHVDGRGLGKRYDLLLNALVGVLARFPNTRAVFVGDGPRRPQFESQASSLGIGDRVDFLGMRRDVERLLNAADAFVLATDYEGMPNAVLEAHASGLPVVGSDVSGVGDIVLDGTTGYLAEPGSAEALEKAMLRVMSLDSTARQEMGRRARARALEFSFDRAVSKWETLLDDVSTPRSSRASSAGRCDSQNESRFTNVAPARSATRLQD
jgi:glycosyltransferase involved in cell wall biosynthesis